MPTGPPVVSGIRQLEDKVDKLITIPCYAYSRTPANITWLFNNKVTQNLEQQNGECEVCIKFSLKPSCSQELQIKRAEESNSGNYTCVVTNEHGSSKFETEVKVGKYIITVLRASDRRRELARRQIIEPYVRGYRQKKSRSECNRNKRMCNNEMT